jgi:hypothetical protein
MFIFLFFIFKFEKKNEFQILKITQILIRYQKFDPTTGKINSHGAFRIVL